jgi:hypothetical protein
MNKRMNVTTILGKCFWNLNLHVYHLQTLLITDSESVGLNDAQGPGFLLSFKETEYCWCMDHFEQPEVGRTLWSHSAQTQRNFFPICICYIGWGLSVVISSDLYLYLFKTLEEIIKQFIAPNDLNLKSLYPFLILFFPLLLCWGGGYIVAFIQVLTMYQIYHTWIYPLLPYLLLFLDAPLI